MDDQTARRIAATGAADQHSAEAEALAVTLATYFHKLTRRGLPKHLVNTLVLQMADSMLGGPTCECECE